jgi:DNA polymerase-1
VLVAWDTLEVPTYRHKKFPAYQSGREFDDALLQQLDLIPEFVAACGFQNAKAPGYAAGLSLPGDAEEKAGRLCLSSGMRNIPQFAHYTTSFIIRGGEMRASTPCRGPRPRHERSQVRFHRLARRPL